MLLLLEIVWPEEWSQGTPGDGTVPLMPFSVDGTHFRINDPGDPKFHSYKIGKAAVNYEVALKVYEDSLIWMSGPHPAGKPDIVVFRESGLKDKILAGMKGIADRGYRGEKHILSTPNNLDDKELCAFKSRARARHETFNRRLKNFKCLAEHCRHKIAKHKILFEAVAVICQYQMEFGSELFDV
jgi:hypothetical protein